MSDAKVWKFITRDERTVDCVWSDGSLMVNSQELVDAIQKLVDDEEMVAPRVLGPFVIARLDEWLPAFATVNEAAFRLSWVAVLMPDNPGKMERPPVYWDDELSGWEDELTGF